MRHIEQWHPTKYVRENGVLKASDDPRFVGLKSRLTVDLLAKVYDSLIVKYAQGRLLDLGCGRVPLFNTYREHVTEVVCVDWPFSFHGTLHLDCSVDLNCQLPIADDTFNTVLLTDVLEHIKNPALLWDEVVRLLCIGGRLIVGVPFMYGIHEQPYDYYRYTEYQLRVFCNERGLEVLHLEPYGGSPEVILDILAKHAVTSKVIALPYYRICHSLLKMSVVQGLSKLTAAKYPLGYSLVAQKIS